jgi:undecaprenyl-diphosphatase
MNSVLDASDHLFLRINAFAAATPWLHGVTAAFASYGVVLFGVLILVGLWQSRGAHDRTLAAAVWTGIGTLFAVALNQPIASLVAQGRPYAAHPTALVLVARTTDWSFPSDHSVMAGACAVGLLLVSRRLGALAAAAALLMAVTRVYVGAHYPLDVVAGLAFGAAVAGLGWLALRRPLTWALHQARQLPVVDRVAPAYQPADASTTPRPGAPARAAAGTAA